MSSTRRRSSKQYAVKLEDGEITSIEVDGVSYPDVGAISDARDRAAVLRLIAAQGGDAELPFDEKEFEADVRAAEESGRRGVSLVTAIFGGVGLLLLAGAALWSFFTVQALTREVSAPGQVVDLVERMSSSVSVDSRTQVVPHPYAYPVVTFMTPDEKWHTVEVAEGTWPPAYEKGQRVTVMYDPAQPARARIESAEGAWLQWLGPGILGLLGGILVTVAALIAWFSRPRDPSVVNPAV